MGKGSTRLQPVQFSIPVESFVTDSLSARCLKVHARTRALSRKTKMPDSNVGLLFRAWPTPERGGNLNLECISYQTWLAGEANDDLQAAKRRSSFADRDEDTLRNRHVSWLAVYGVEPAEAVAASFTNWTD
ncbi:MAG: hypothetical protein DME75_06670 [Verrucomicrobia bacterium]|nr:MAG: hypothetical protein DME75_06670 [Verrucomicrobiota bacterium]